MEELEGHRLEALEGERGEEGDTQLSRRQQILAQILESQFFIYFFTILF